MPREIRPPAVAGTFYPAEPDRLQDLLHQQLKLAEQSSPPTSSVTSLISPHAGYRYSGQTAAAGFHFVSETEFEATIIVAPSHREYFDGISVFDGAGYATPLGVSYVDTGLRDELLRMQDLIRPSSLGHGPEHAVEVQLPFLQLLFPGATILPIVMGDQRREYCHALGVTLSQLCRDRKVLLIASTDLSHYHDYNLANELDSIAEEHISRFDVEGFMSALEADVIEACGGGPTVAIMTASLLLGAKRAVILDRRNSGDVTFDRTSVVGYLSAALLP